MKYYDIEYNPYFIFLNIEADKKVELSSYLEYFKNQINYPFLFMKRNLNNKKWDMDKKGWNTEIEGTKIHKILNKVIELIKSYE